MFVRDLLKKTRDIFVFNPKVNSIYESQLLISNILKKKLIEIILKKKLRISEKNKKKFLKKIFLRKLGKPISKIIGQKEFYSRNFFVNCYTLDPRPESELIIDCVKKLEIFKKKKVKILDLGTGSGCLLISTILELKKKNIYGVGVDICENALKIAKKNAKKFHVYEYLKFSKSNWFSNIDEKFDLIISNPPYIRKFEIKSLSSEVKNFDPFISLNGGESGLEAYKKIAQRSKKFLNSHGFICVEIGSEQNRDVTKIFELHNFSKIDELKDLSKKDRVLLFKNKI